MERALSIPSWPASNGPVYSTKTRMPPRRGRSPAKFSTTGTASPPSSPIPICRPPTTMPRQHSGMRPSQGGSASEREPGKRRALMRPSSASLKPAGGERSMRGVSSQKPSGMPGEANRQRPSRHLPNPGKVNGYVKVVNGTVVYMRDVAYVHDSAPPQTNVVQLEGKKGVLMTVLKAGSVSTLDIIAGIKKLLPVIAESMPKGLEMKLVGDQSAFVRSAVDTVIEEGDGCRADRSHD